MLPGSSAFSRVLFPPGTARPRLRQNAVHLRSLAGRQRRCSRRGVRLLCADGGRRHPAVLAYGEADSLAFLAPFQVVRTSGCRSGLLFTRTRSAGFAQLQARTTGQYRGPFGVWTRLVRLTSRKACWPLGLPPINSVSRQVSQLTTY